MKYIFVLLCVFYSIYSKAENIESTYIKNITTNTSLIMEDKEGTDTFYKHSAYWKRHKILKITGYSALGLGGTMMTIGFLFNIIKNYDNNEGQHPQGYKIVGFVGVGITAASVSLLTFSYINKKKAKQISINMESMKVCSPDGTMQTTPSLSFRIHF